MSQPYWKARDDPGPPASQTLPGSTARPDLFEVEQEFEPQPVQMSPVQRSAAQQRLRLHKAADLIRLLSGGLAWLIGLRILLRLVAANPESGFARLIFGITGPFVAPFQGLVQEVAFGPLVLEVSSIIAIFVLAMLAWFAIRLMWLLLYWPDPSLQRPSPPEDRAR